MTEVSAKKKMPRRKIILVIFGIFIVLSLIANKNGPQTRTTSPTPPPTQQENEEKILPIQQFIDEHNNEDIEMHCVEGNCKNLLAILLSSEYDYVSTENICRGLIIQAYDIQGRTSMICRHSGESISCTKSGDNPPSCASAN